MPDHRDGNNRLTDEFSRFVTGLGK